MIFERLPVGGYEANCYIIGCEKSREAIIVDPGENSDYILERINELEVKPKYIVLTHGHGDHIGAVPEIKKVLKIPVMIHKDDEELIIDAEKNYSKHMKIGAVEIKPDKLLHDQDKIKFGDLIADIIHTPGHTPGGISIKIGDNILTGDTLFSNSIGRTDFFGGSFDNIIKSIKDKILIYNDEVKIFPGHGEETTVGKERLTNPFLN